MADLKKVQIQLLNAETGEFIEDVTPLTQAYSIVFSDGSTLEEKLKDGSLKGEDGDSFEIVKTYKSISDMNADFSNTDISEGSFVLINTDDVEDPDNAKLYVKGSDAYGFIVDLSGATGIRGPKGEAGSQIYVGTTISGDTETAKTFTDSEITKAAVNDVYINSSTGELYTCSVAGDAATATWIKKGSIKGADGNAGTKGTTILYGTAFTEIKKYSEGMEQMILDKSSDVIDPSTVQAKDLYLDTNTGILFKCVSVEIDSNVSHWSYVTTLKGDKGEDGITWLTGTAITKTSSDSETVTIDNSNLSEFKTGDFYLNSNTKEVFQCEDITDSDDSSTSTWKYITTLKGTDGTKWITGTQYTVKSSSDKYLTGAVEGMNDGDIYFNTSTFEIFKYTLTDTKLTLIADLSSQSAAADSITVGVAKESATPVKLFFKIIE